MTHLPPMPVVLLSDRLRIGAATVDVPLREIHAPGARRPQRITPKAMGVLLALARTPGRVVPRDTLLAEVWPGTLPTNDVVTQAVTQLRKALGDPAAIETIAKTGYRLLAEVEWIGPAPVAVSSIPASPMAPDVGGATTAPAPAAGPRRSLRELAVVGGVLFAAAVVLALVAALRAPPPAARDGGQAWIPSTTATARPFTLITSAPGFEHTPTLSPDAAQIAYVASRERARGTAILVQTTAATTPRALTQPPTGLSDRMPAWSPDGREIAFLRTGTDACQVLVVPSSGGAEREVARCDPRDMVSFSWTPDSRGLLFGSMGTPQGPAGVRVLDLASGRWRAIAYTDAGRELDYMPRYSPDGRWIVFARNPQLGDLWRLPAEGGTPQPLTGQRAELRGWDWLPDGRALVFGRRVDTGTRIYRLDLDSRRVHDLGIEQAQAPAVARRTAVMAFVRREPAFGVFQVERDGRGGIEPSAHLFASSRRDTQPAVAPDGRQLVFVSDRAGTAGLWWADLQRPDSLRVLSGFIPETRRLPEWSADARTVLAIGRAGGTFGLHELTPATGRIERLPAPVADPVQALYLPDPTRLLVGADDGKGGMRLTLFDRSVRPWRALARLDDVSMARFDAARGRVLFTRLSADGLWQVGPHLDPTGLRIVDAAAPRRWDYRKWDVAGDGRIHLIEQRAGCASTLVELGRNGAQPARCLSADHLIATNGFSASARNDALYVPLATEDGSDIAFMRLPPAPPSEVAGWFN